MRRRSILWSSCVCLAGILLAACSSGVPPETVRGCTLVPGAHCPGANLSGATVDFSGIDLEGADLSHADLSRAQLEPEVGVNPTDHMSVVNLSNATLQEADLRGASMEGIDLNEANLAGADLQGAVFFNYSTYTGQGPSFIGVTWSNTTCPDGTNSNTDGGTCLHNLTTSN